MTARVLVGSVGESVSGRDWEGEAYSIRAQLLETERPWYLKFRNADTKSATSEDDALTGVPLDDDDSVRTAVLPP